MDYFDWYAAYLHRTCPIVDAHLDLVTEVYRRRLVGEKGVLNKYYRKEFLKSGVNLVFASLFLGEDELRDCKEEGRFFKGAVLKKSMEMLAAFYEDMEETKGRVQLVTDQESLYRLTTKRGLSRRHKVGVLLYLEGLDMLEGEPELLYCFYKMGVRGAALTWNRRREPQNVFAQGACGGADIEENESEGREETNKTSLLDTEYLRAITDKGVEALFLMEKLGIFVDSSHLSRRAAWLLPSFTKKPFVATHSNAAALWDHPRNLTDEEIEEIAGRGGVIGVNAYEGMNYSLLGDAASKTICDQIVYMLERAGENHVGLGLDLGEGSMLEGYEKLEEITAELLRRGCSIESVKKVLGGNWIRFLAGIWKADN